MGSGQHAVKGYHGCHGPVGKKPNDFARVTTVITETTFSADSVDNVLDWEQILSYSYGAEIYLKKKVQI